MAQNLLKTLARDPGGQLLLTTFLFWDFKNFYQKSIFVDFGTFSFRNRV